MSDSPNRVLRRKLERGAGLLLPGAANALTARVIEPLGFDAFLVTGAGIANTYLGAPDIGLVTASEVADHVAAISDAVGLPLIVDMDTGFGNAHQRRAHGAAARARRGQRAADRGPDLPQALRPFRRART